MHYCEENLTGACLESSARDCLGALEAANIQPSCVVMQGISGMAVGMVLAAKLGCHYAVIRKPGEDSHSGRNIEGVIPATGQVVIVDDFVSEGHTMIRMIEALRASKGWNPHRDLTVLLYQQANIPAMPESALPMLHRVAFLPCGRRV